MVRTKMTLLATALAVMLAVAAPAAAEEEDQEPITPCVDVSVDPPGADVDPICIIEFILDLIGGETARSLDEAWVGR